MSTTHASPATGTANHPGVLRHVPEFDGIRALALLIVFRAHFYGPFNDARVAGILSPFFVRANFGVDLFFVLSGFLITSILLATRGAPGYYRNFYMRRVLRIMPLYCFVVGVFFWIVLPIAHHSGKFVALRASDQIWYWTFLQNWRMSFGHNGAQLAHLWSLGIEEQFYLVWCVLIAFIAGRRFITTCTALLIAGIALRFILATFTSTSDHFLMWSSVTRLDGILIGSLLAASPRARRWLAPIAWWAIPLAVCILVTKYPPLWVRPAIASIAGGALIARAISGPIPILRSRILRNLGKYSYGMFLLHYPLHPVIVAIAHRHMNWYGVFLAFVFGISSSYVLGFLSWHLLEHPFLRLKKLFTYSKTRDLAAAAEVAPNLAPPASRSPDPSELTPAAPALEIALPALEQPARPIPT